MPSRAIYHFLEIMTEVECHTAKCGVLHCYNSTAMEQAANFPGSGSFLWKSAWDWQSVTKYVAWSWVEQELLEQLAGRCWLWLCRGCMLYLCDSPVQILWWVDSSGPAAELLSQRIVCTIQTSVWEGKRACTMKLCRPAACPTQPNPTRLRSRGDPGQQVSFPAWTPPPHLSFLTHSIRRECPVTLCHEQDSSLWILGVELSLSVQHSFPSIKPRDLQWLCKWFGIVQQTEISPCS